jgi:hypothetical protein
MEWISVKDTLKWGFAIFAICTFGWFEAICTIMFISLID